MQNNLKPDEITSRIRHLMQKMDKNQAAMAKACGISSVALHLYLTGKRTPTVDMLSKIVLGAQESGLKWVTMDWMVFGREISEGIQIVEGNFIDRNYDLLTTNILDIVQALDMEKKRTMLKLLEDMTTKK